MPMKAGEGGGVDPAGGTAEDLLEYKVAILIHKLEHLERKSGNQMDTINCPKLCDRRDGYDSRPFQLGRHTT